MTVNPDWAAEELVAEYLDPRLDNVSGPPGIREAVVARLTARIEDILERGDAQRHQLRARGPNRPSVYYAHEEAPEQELQAVLAGIRTALAMEGHMVDGPGFERDATAGLGSTAAWAIRSDGSRVPRPPTRPADLAWSLPPVPWLSDTSFVWPPPEAVVLEPLFELPGEPARCAERPYEGWVQLGLLEEQHTHPTRHPAAPRREFTLSVGLEVTNGGTRGPYLPFAGSAPEIWTHRFDELVPEMTSAQAAANLVALNRALTNLVEFDHAVGDPHPFRGPGRQLFVLAPHIELVALLGLRPEWPSMRMALVDDAGLALVSRQWHGFLVHDEHFEPLEPAVIGTDLLLRPDLYDDLRTAVGDDRLLVGLLLKVETENHDVVQE